MFWSNWQFTCIFAKSARKITLQMLASDWLELVSHWIVAERAQTQFLVEFLVLYHCGHTTNFINLNVNMRLCFCFFCFSVIIESSYLWTIVCYFALAYSLWLHGAGSSKRHRNVSLFRCKNVIIINFQEQMLSQLKFLLSSNRLLTD